MRNLCIVHCNGRICKDPKIYNLPDGTAFCSFSIAVDYSVKNGDTYDSVAMFFDVTTYQKGIFEYLEKGRLISVYGSLTFSKWTDQNGLERENHQIKADNIELLPRGGAQEKQQEKKTFQSTPQMVNSQQSYQNLNNKQKAVASQVTRIQQMKSNAAIGPDAFDEDNMDF